MPSPDATMVFPSRATRARLCNGRVAPLDITARADAYHARQLRITFRQWLHAAGVVALLADDVTWAAYEALANVVEHAYPPDHLHPVMRLQSQMCPPLLRVSITDYGRWCSSAQKVGNRGRGLTVMRAVTTRTHVIHSTHGTTVVLFAGLGWRAPARDCLARMAEAKPKIVVNLR
jgi:serine/threonine-protein kinase RsbW